MAVYSCCSHSATPLCGDGQLCKKLAYSLGIVSIGLARFDSGLSAPPLTMTE